MGLEIRELGSEWDARWDALVGQTSESGFMQSSAWAAFKRAEGYETLRCGLFEAEELTGGASLLTYSAQGNEGFILCPEGPILPWHDPEKAREGLRLLAHTVEREAEQRGGLGLRIEPHLPPPRPSLMRNWTRAPVDLNPIHSLTLDLTLSEEAFRAQMRPKGRYNLGLAQRHGVTVTRSREMRDLSRFYALFEETAQRQSFFAEPFGFFLNLGAALFPVGQAELFFAEWQDQTLAAVLVILFGRRATYLYGGSSPRHRNVMATYALHWEVMQTAREQGCIEYDLYGYDPFGLPDHLYAGFSRFKQQFGGRRIDNIGAYDLLFYDRLAASLVERLAHG
ncbi:MAG: Methicillin resistance protein [Chthonomonadaceae bacterium]|nr:Methicillin resistance protein [Chthonomonadaceae bacterium]